MADKEYIVGGYCFGSVEDVKQAQKEQKQSKYFESKVEGRNALGILAAYDKMLEQKIFSTPIGWDYLLKIQEKLRLLGVKEEKIRPIPLCCSFTNNNKGEREASQETGPVPKSERKIKKENISFSLNIVLIILVVVMFVIALSSDNPNILNYRKEILNEYASWEQDLTQREQEIRKKEAELLENGGIGD